MIFFFNFDNDVAANVRAMQLKDAMCLIKTLLLMDIWQFQIFVLLPSYHSHGKNSHSYTRKEIQ